jgi:hypothetical protein
MTSCQAKRQEDVYFRVMRIPQEKPDPTQRELAEKLGIPPGVVRGLANPGTIHLEIIEVQSGSYCAGDDIVRLDDAYGRKSLWH